MSMDVNAVGFRRTFVIVLATAFIAVSPVAFAISDSCEYTGPPSPPRGAMVGEVRVMTMNVWGQNDDSETKCEARLKYIGKKLANQRPLFDIIGLTEVHPDYVGLTCDGEKLVDGLRVNGQYKKGKARWGHPETSALYYDGGTSIFSTSEFDWKPYKDHVERYRPYHRTRTAHGFTFARIPLIRESTDANGGRVKDHRAGMVDVYVTHLYSKGGGSTKCDQQCRYDQLQQLARGIHERSANSGNPVLVMGDFNIGGPNPTAESCEGNPGYGDIMDVLRNPRDIWLEAHPNQRGDTKAGDSHKRIDFIFVLTDRYFTNSTRQLVLSHPRSVRLIDWKMPGYSIANSLGPFGGPTRVEGPFAVSDHYGIEATFEVQRVHKNEVVNARRGGQSGNNEPADRSTLQCSRASKSTCGSNGATCDVIDKTDGSSRELCRWDSISTEAACSKTPGLWTKTNSRYAKNHPGAVPTGKSGACISEAANLSRKR